MLASWTLTLARTCGRQSSSVLNGRVSSTRQEAGDSTYQMTCPQAPVIIETTAALDTAMHFGRAWWVLSVFVAVVEHNGKGWGSETVGNFLKG